MLFRPNRREPEASFTIGHPSDGTWPVHPGCASHQAQDSRDHQEELRDDGGRKDQAAHFRGKTKGDHNLELQSFFKKSKKS